MIFLRILCLDPHAVPCHVQTHHHIEWTTVYEHYISTEVIDSLDVQNINAGQAVLAEEANFGSREDDDFGDGELL